MHSRPKHVHQPATRQNQANYVLIKNIFIIGIRAGEFIRRNHVKGAKVMRQVDVLAAQGVLKPTARRGSHSIRR